jgi:outer membrane protein TolC
MLRNLLVVLGACVLLGGTDLRAQDELIKKYYEDVPVSKVEIGPLRQLGRWVGDKLYLTEGKAIELALENNYDLNLERHNRLLREWDITLDRSAYDPTGNFGFNWNRAKTPSASVLSGGPSVTDIVTDYTFGYEHPFSTGSSLQVDFKGIRNRTTNFFSSLVPAINTQFNVTFHQKLLEGFMKADAEYDLEISRNNLELSGAQFRAEVINVVSQVQDGFWELDYSLQDIEVKQKSLELAQTTYEQNQARLEVGTASRLEVVQAQAEVALRREELIGSQSSYRLAQDRLIKLITSLDDPRKFSGQLVPDQTKRKLPQPEPYDQLIESAISLRPEIQQSDLTIANREVDLSRSRDKLRPSLDFVGGYQQFGLGGTTVERDFSQGFINPPIVAIIPGGLGDALSQTFSGTYYGYVVGLNLQFPIHNTEARARNAQAQIELNQARMQRGSVKQNIGTEIRNTLTLIEGNRARVEASETAVKAAQERVDGEQARFDVGMGTTRDLLEAQRDLMVAQSVLLRARIDLIENYATLDQAVGRTLQRHNIILKDAEDQNVVRPGD